MDARKSRQSRWMLMLGIAIIILLIGLLGFSSPALSETVTYTYDSLNRLKSVVYSNNQELQYSYDASGNTTRITATAPHASQKPTPPSEKSATVSETPINPITLPQTFSSPLWRLMFWASCIK